MLRGTVSNEQGRGDPPGPNPKSEASGERGRIAAGLRASAFSLLEELQRQLSRLKEFSDPDVCRFIEGCEREVREIERQIRALTPR